MQGGTQAKRTGPDHHHVGIHQASVPQPPGQHMVPELYSIYLIFKLGFGAGWPRRDRQSARLTNALYGAQ